MMKSARCDCYNGHSSASGRCNVRNVTDPSAAQRDDAVLCERCHKECAPTLRKKREKRDAGPVELAKLLRF